MTTISRAVRRAEKILKTAGIATARLDAEVLLASISGLDRSVLLLTMGREVSDRELATLERWTARRALGEPVARITGSKEFWSLDFRINSDTLVPRPESETLVEVIVDYVRSTPLGIRYAWKILDLGTGSGCLLLALLNELEGAVGIGVDRAEGVVNQARENSIRFGLSKRAEFMVADWRTSPAGIVKSSAPFDFIISNPPYIESDQIQSLPIEVRAHDPVLALDGGKDGLECLPYIFSWASELLLQGGVMALEMGKDQALRVRAMIQKEDFEEIHITSDLAGIERVIRCWKS